MARGAIVLVVAMLAGVVPVTGVALAAVAAPTAVAVAPTCMTAGAPTRTVIVGAGWSDGAVTLSQNGTVLGTPIARASPVRQRSGSFSFSTTITAAAAFTITAQQGDLSLSVGVGVQSGCPILSVKPPCLDRPGPVQVQVSGEGFSRNGQVSIDVDPFGNAEGAAGLSVTSDNAGSFSTPLTVPFAGATIPIVATQLNNGLTGVASGPPSRAVAFVDPCPPPPTTSTTTTTRPHPAATTTTVGPVGATTTTSGTPGTTPPGTPPPVPPVTIPGATAQVAISPSTVRPGRCNVIVVSAAPPGLAVVARYTDGPPVNGLTGPGGGAVLSVCEAHDSGNLLGPVKVLIGIGPLPPAPVFTVLRVPARPQPPLLQAGADDRRS